MKLDATQIDRLAQGLVNLYRQKDFITVRKDDAQLKLAIEEALQRNFDEEEAIEKEARQLIASHAQESNNLDTHKAMLLIKQRLARKKGFLL